MNRQSLRQASPDLQQKLLPGPFGSARNRSCADAAFEITGQLRARAVRQASLQHLPADQGLGVTRPHQARHFPGAETDGWQVQQLRVRVALTLDGHHGRGAPQVDGQGREG